MKELVLIKMQLVFAKNVTPLWDGIYLLENVFLVQLSKLVAINVLMVMPLMK
jgi:hypothetical protein